MHAAERYSWLTRTSFASVLADLSSRHGLRVGAPNDAATLAAAFNAVDEARLHFIRGLTDYADRRRHEKRSGRRWPTAQPEQALCGCILLGSSRADLFVGRAP
jgi:hypothetical protein